MKLNTHVVATVMTTAIAFCMIMGGMSVWWMIPVFILVGILDATQYTIGLNRGYEIGSGK